MCRWPSCRAAAGCAPSVIATAARSAVTSPFHLTHVATGIGTLSEILRVRFRSLRHGLDHPRLSSIIHLRRKGGRFGSSMPFCPHSARKGAARDQPGSPLQGQDLSERSLDRFVEAYLGAGRGNRTPMTLRSADFESAASASSAIPALFVTSKRLYSITSNQREITSARWRSACSLAGLMILVSHSIRLSTYSQPRRLGQSHAAPRTPLESPYFA